MLLGAVVGVDSHLGETTWMLFGVVVGVVPLFRNLVDNLTQVKDQNLVEPSPPLVVPGFACHGTLEQIERSQGQLRNLDQPNRFLVAGVEFLKVVPNPPPPGMDIQALGYLFEWGSCHNSYGGLEYSHSLEIVGNN